MIILTKYLNFFTPSKRNLNTMLKWFILVTSYTFLLYKFLTFQQYPAIVSWWQNVPASYLGWLLAVFFLLPINWFSETLKWKILVSKSEKISLKNAFLSVLAGIVSGFFTPNRVGEMVGRILYLKPENRKSGITLSLLNSFSQNIIIAAFGIPAFVFFFGINENTFSTGKIHYLLFVSITLLICISFFYFLRFYLNNSKKGRVSVFLKKYMDSLAALTGNDILKIIFITTLRYVIFCLQFYFMLRFFGVELTAYQAIIAIPTTYLLVTFTPSLAFSEAAVRSSFAVLIIGAFSSLEVQIILAGVGIWVVNFVLPLMLGSVLLLQKGKS